MKMELVLCSHLAADGSRQFSASARLPLPGRDVQASAIHAEASAAIQQVVGRLFQHACNESIGLEGADTPLPARKTLERVPNAGWSNRWTAWHHYQPAL
jgi:hypothetical protein